MKDRTTFYGFAIGILILWLICVVIYFVPQAIIKEQSLEQMVTTIGASLLFVSGIIIVGFVVLDYLFKRNKTTGGENEKNSSNNEKSIH